MKRIKLLDIIVFLFVIMFVYAAVSKLIKYDLFMAQIGKSPLIGSYSIYIAWIVPSIEIIISLMLLIPRWLIVGLYASFTMMFLFTCYVFFILKFSPYVPCSCGGVLNNMGWTEHLFFNIGFTALSVFGIWHYDRREEHSQLIPC